MFLDGCCIGHNQALGFSRKRKVLKCSRGLNGMELIISDDHIGLKSARKAVFQRFLGKGACFI